MVVEYGGYNYSHAVYVSGDAVSIRHSTIRYNYGTGIYVDGASPTIQEGEIYGNGGDAIYLTSPSSVPLVEGNDIHDNGGDVIVQQGGSVTCDQTWASVDVPYCILNDVTVDAGATLAIAPGVVVEMAYQSTDLVVNGTLNAVGTAGAPIVFTSDRTTPGDWGAIHLHNAATLDYVVVEYGGYYSYYYNHTAVYVSGNAVSIRHSTIRYNQGDGIYVDGASPALRYNEIYGNGGYGVYNADDTQVVDARYNWWGDVSGPSPFGSGDGINYDTCYDSDTGTYYICEYHVRVDPWIGKQTEESEDLIDDALPDDVVRNTAPMEPGVPYIVSVSSWYGNVFIGSHGGSDNEWQASVDWNGSDPGKGSPGRVEFRMNNDSKTVNGDADGAKFRYAVGDLHHGDNSLAITAISADGQQRSRTFTLRPYRLTLPEWIKKLGVSAGRLSVTYSPKYVSIGFTAKYPDPAFKAEMSLPSSIPFIGGYTGIRKTQASLALTLRSDGKGSARLSGTTGFETKADSQGYKRSVDGTLSGSGTAGLTPAGGIALYEAGLGFKINGALTQREPVVSVIPAMAAAAHTPIIGNILDTVYIEGKVEPGVNVETKFKADDDGSDLHWTGVSGGGTLKITLALGVEVSKKVNASAYGGGQGSLQFQVPPNPSYLKKASGGFFVGAKLKAFGFEVSREKTWEWSYQPRATNMLLGNTLAAPVWIVRSSVISETDWHVEQPDYGDTSYAQFVGGHAALNAPTAIQGLTETPLVTNLYQDANPALSLRGNDALLVWVHDDLSLPESQSKEILSSWWNGLSWATPVSVTDNTMSEFDPQLVFVNSGQALAIWERLNDPALPVSATFDYTTTRKMELAYATFDLSDHTWSSSSLLTDNDILDHHPSLAAGEDGTAMVTWISNATGELAGSADTPDTLHYAIWNGANWTLSGTIASQVTGTLEVGLGYRNVNSATLVVSLDTDGYFTTTDDIELFYSEWDGSAWSDLTRLITNTLPDESPTVLYTHDGERRLVWLQDGHVTLLKDDWSASPVVTEIASESAALRDYKAALDDEDNLIIIWQGMSDEGTDLYYAIYDAETATWNLESQLTHSYAMEKQVSPAFDPSGQLMVAYALDHLTETVKIISPTLIITGVTEYDHTDLYVLHYTPDTDLTVSDFSLPEYFENPWPGDVVDLYATVQNAGDWNVVSPTISFYDGDPNAGGTLITTTYVVSGPLVGGMSQEVSVRWTVPVTPVQPHTLYAVVDSADHITETDETNNVITLTTVTPDVAVSSAKTYYYDQHQVVPLAIVANNGPVTATNILVEFRADSITGTVSYSEVIATLEPDGLAAITTTWGVSSWPEGSHLYYVTLDSNDTIAEVNETDNWDYFPVKVLPDLVVYAGDVQADLTTGGGPVTVTVRNWGTADAMSVPVTLYEGPTITTGATALYTWTVASLPVDSDGNVQLSTTLDHRPNRLFAIADPVGVITEVEEYNNVALLVQPISVTFRYHDLEGIIPSTATVTLEGDWTTRTITLTGTGGIYSVTLNLSEIPLTYRYVVSDDVYLLNTYSRTVTPTVMTAYDDYRNVAIGWAQLDGPTTLSTTVGIPTTPITARVYITNVTPLDDSGGTIQAELGYGTSITLTEWTWTPITFSADLGNYDQFAGVITPTVSGTYSYTIRFDGNWGAGNPYAAWVYADLDGTTNGFSLGHVGVLTVP